MPARNSLPNRSLGFTVIELLVVVVIIGLIMVFAVPAASNLLRGSVVVRAANALTDEISRARQRQVEARNSFAASHDDAMDFPDPVGPAQPTPAFPESRRMMEEPRMAESSPVAMSHSGGEVISLDTMRSAMVANFEQDDLDVPAFLRKRGEVM